MQQNKWFEWSDIKESIPLAQQQFHVGLNVARVFLNIFTEL